MSSEKVTVNGVQYEIARCQAKDGLRALSILSRNAKHIEPILRRFAEVKVGETDSIRLIVDLLAIVQPLLDGEALDDLFRFTSLLSGIGVSELEMSTLDELAEVLRTIWKMNDVLSMLSSVLPRG